MFNPQNENLTLNGLSWVHHLLIHLSIFYYYYFDIIINIIIIIIFIIIIIIIKDALVCNIYTCGSVSLLYPVAIFIPFSPPQLQTYFCVKGD